MTTADETALVPLRESLAALCGRRITINDFCRIWRAQGAVPTALPARYAQVMEDLLGRLEAGSLFTEESCSFSQQDLHAGLATWLDKANQFLQAGKP